MIEPILDEEKAEAEKKLGIKKVSSNVNDKEWKEAFTETFRMVCENNQEFSMDDFWPIFMDKYDIDFIEHGIHHPSLVGALVNSFARRKNNRLIRWTGRYLDSKKVSRHKGPLKIWESLIYIDKVIVVLEEI